LSLILSVNNVYFQLILYLPINYIIICIIIRMTLRLLDRY